MAEGSKKVEPWQLIMILILVLAFFGGLYLTNQAISSQLESIQGAIDAKTETLKSGIESINRRLDHMKAIHTAEKAAAPAPAPTAEPAAEGEAQPAEPAAKPADDGTVPAASEKKE